MEVEVGSAITKRLRKSLRRAGSREIGGILMGEQLAPSHFRVIDFSLDDKTGEEAHFVRSAEYHNAALDDFFIRTGGDFSRFNYLGEWHSHPKFAVLPSRQDYISMDSLVNSGGDLEFSMLLIVKLRWWVGLECSATLFARHATPAPIQLRFESL